MADPITVAEVCAHMGVDPATLTPTDAAHVAASVAAVLAMVPRIVPRVRAADPGADWPGDVKQGAVQLAARLFARRNSPTGVAGFSDMGGAAFVARYDPDLERLFGIGKWGPPVCA
jgi:hypothetical protein